MAENKEVFVFIATYGGMVDARADFEAVGDLHDRGIIGTYDAALVEKDSQGKVHVHKREMPTRKGAWTGIAVGAVVGILFPPSIIGSAAVGGATGGLIGHLWRGMSRKDMKELGEALDDGTAALVVVGQVRLSDTLAPATSRAKKTTEKQVNVKAKDFDQELTAATPAAS